MRFAFSCGAARRSASNAHHGNRRTRRLLPWARPRRMPCEKKACAWTMWRRERVAVRLPRNCAGPLPAGASFCREAIARTESFPPRCALRARKKWGRRLPTAPRSRGVDSGELAAIQDVDVVAFASPSALHHFVEAIGEEKVRALAARARFAAIGPTTARAIRDAGLSRVHRSGRIAGRGTRSGDCRTF